MVFLPTTIFIFKPMKCWKNIQKVCQIAICGVGLSSNNYFLEKMKNRWHKNIDFEKKS